MSNKLKKIFSSEEISYGGKIHFQNQEASKKFSEALDEVWKNGKAVEVEGVASISEEVRQGEKAYPLDVHSGILKFIVAPSIEEEPIELDTEFGKRKLVFKRYFTETDMVLMTSEDSIVYIKMLFNKITTKLTFSYRAQPNKANSVQEIIENYCIVLALIQKMFITNAFTISYDLESHAAIKNMNDYFTNMILLYKKMEFIERKVKVLFEPSQLVEDAKTRNDFEELYLILKENRIIRLNERLKVTENTGVTIKQALDVLEIGKELDLTFLGHTEYDLGGKRFTLYTANLLTNAFIKDIKEMPNGDVKILYGDDDSRPMYISYSGFLTEAEASEEINKIMENKECYVNALTVSEYLRKDE